MNKMYLVIIIGVLVVAYFVYSNNTSPEIKPQEGYVIPRGSVHWHSYLKIFINGQEQIIPTDIGLSNVHEPLHTHDFSGELHMENSNPSARPETLTLGYLFKLWGNPFNKTCIFEFCNGPNSTVKMYVNGIENDRFGDYYMSDGDQIEIRYE